MSEQLRSRERPRRRGLRVGRALPLATSVMVLVGAAVLPVVSATIAPTSAQAAVRTLRIGLNSGDQNAGLVDTYIGQGLGPQAANFYGALATGPDGHGNLVLLKLTGSSGSASFGDAVREAIARDLPEHEQLTEVTEVRLAMNLFVTQGRGETTVAEIREITSPWDVAAATYTQRTASAAWSAPGADLADTSVGSITFPNQPGTHQSSTNLVALMSPKAGSDGIALRVTSPIVWDNNTLPYLSEAPDGKRPYVEVSYTTGPHGGTPGVPGVPYDSAQIPVGSTGSDQVLIRPTAEVPKPSGGEFRTVCGYSHMAPDDPIVYPGRPGAAHLHVFWGNTAANASSSYESLRASGNSTCRGGIANRSAYWAPAIIDTATGRPIAPVAAHTYYKVGAEGLDGTEIHSMPQGLKMIAGDMHASGPQDGDFAFWDCIDGRGERTSHSSDLRPCMPGTNQLRMFLRFPQCWDGKNLDSPDHKSHMAYVSRETKRCPDTHPVGLPEVTHNVDYDMRGGPDTSSWRLSSDTYDRTQPPGYSIHGDWIGAWDPAIQETWTTRCLNAKVDCISNMLGDGREQYGFDPPF